MIKMVTPTKHSIIERGPAAKEYFSKAMNNLADYVLERHQAEKTQDTHPGVGDTKFTDLKIICKDGAIRCHQVVLARHSLFIRSLLLRHHVLEFDPNIDWDAGSAYLSGRRKLDDEVIIIVNDFERDTISQLLSCFYKGILTFKDRESGKKLKEAWDAFSIDTVRLADLSWTSEVTDIESHPVSSNAPFSPKKPKPTGKKRSASLNLERDAEGTNKSKSQKVDNLGDDKTSSLPDSTESHLVYDIPSDASVEAAQNKWASIRSMPAGEPENQNKNKSLNCHISVDAVVKSTSVDDCHLYRCEICNNEIAMSSSNSRGNLLKYQKHILIHSDKALFGELPYLDRYYCPHSLNEERQLDLPSSKRRDKNGKIYQGIANECRCDEAFEDREEFQLHLFNDHDEFYPRLLRRLRETGSSTDTFPTENKAHTEEYDQLKTIKRALQNTKTQEMLDLRLPVNPTKHYLYTEEDFVVSYEERFMVANPWQFLHCTMCAMAFKSPENALLHLYLNHYPNLAQKLEFVSENRDMSALNNASTMLGLNNAGHLSVRTSYFCPFDSCPNETFCKGDFVRHIFSNHDIFKSIEINELIQNFTETRLFKQYAHLNHKKHSDIRKILTPIKTTSPGKCHKKTSDDTVDVDVIASHSATSAGMHDNANSSTRASNVQSYPNLSISATNIQTPNLRQGHSSSEEPKFHCQECFGKKRINSMTCSSPQKDVFPLESKAMADHLSSAIHRNNRPTTVSCLTCLQNITCYSKKDVTNHMCQIPPFSPNNITTSRPINNAGSIDKNSGTVLID